MRSVDAPPLWNVHAQLHLAVERDIEVLGILPAFEQFAARFGGDSRRQVLETLDVDGTETLEQLAVC